MIESRRPLFPTKPRAPLSRLALCLVFAAVSGVVPFTSAPVSAEDLEGILKKVTQYYQEKNYTKALEELGWAQKELEKANSSVTESFFPENLAGLQGGKIESANMFGMSTIERSYSGAGTTIKVSLIAGSKGQGQNPLGGLAAFGQMAAMMGNQPGVESFRIDGRTASLESEEKSATLTVFLDGGSMIKFEMNGSADGEKLKKFAGELKIGDIEKHLKG